MKNKYLISILGPTAIGKTSLSLFLAKHFNTEILSSDSRQFYQEMAIGTAVPTSEELSSIPHYFIQNRSIHNQYTVGDYEKEALTVLETLFKSNDIVILVGGSGLFHKALVEGLDDFPEVDAAIRAKLSADLNKDGIHHLQLKLKNLDPESYNSIDINNPHRIIRALEICIGTGQAFSSFKSARPKTRPFSVINIGLTADRTVIYERINLRVDQMITQGLIEEAKALHKFKNLNALNTVGYKELFQFFEGKLTLEESVSQIKMNTRRFAKRQLTWFKKDNSIKWFNHTEPYDNILRHLLDKELES